MPVLPCAVELDSAEMKVQRANARAASLSKKRAEFAWRSSSVHFAAERGEELSSPCRRLGSGGGRGGKPLAPAGHGQSRASSEAPPCSARAASLNPHRAARAAMRTCLKRGAMESASDVPTISRGKPGRKASISPLMVGQTPSQTFEAALDGDKFCLNSEDDAVTTEAADSVESCTSDEEEQGVSEQRMEEEEDHASTSETSDLRLADAEVRMSLEDEVAVARALAEVEGLETVRQFLDDTKKQAEVELEAMKEQAEAEARQIKRKAVEHAVAVHVRAEAAAKAKQEAEAERQRAAEEERQREAERQLQEEQRKKAAAAIKQAKAMEQQRAKQFRKEAERARHTELQKERELAAAREQAALELAKAQQEAAQTKAEACALQARLREEIRAKARAEAEAAKKQAEAEAQAIRAKAEAEARALQEQAQADLHAAREAATAARAAGAKSGVAKGRQSAAVPSELIENEEVEADWEVLPQKSIAAEAEDAGQWAMVM